MKKQAKIIKGALRIGRFSVPYRIYENSGPHLVCLNGVQQSMAMWHSLVSRFSRRYRILLFDFPGQGKGEVLSGPPGLSIDEQVDILSRLMQAAKVREDCTLCAASWGGVVAVAFASRYPERVKRMILASLGTRPNKKMVETIKNGTRIGEANRDEMAAVLIKSFGQDLPENIKSKIVAQFRAMSSESLRAFSEHGLFVISTKGLADVVDLKNIKAETILINGEKDTIVDLEDVKYLGSQIPNCRMRVIKDVGHFLHLEQEGVLDIYEEILKKEVPV